MRVNTPPVISMVEPGTKRTEASSAINAVQFTIARSGCRGEMDDIASRCHTSGRVGLPVMRVVV
jgi:hypothetical protein